MATHRLTVFAVALLAGGGSAVALARPHPADDGVEKARAQSEAIDANHNNTLEAEEVTPQTLRIKPVARVASPTDAVVWVDGAVWSVSSEEPKITRVSPKISQGHWELPLPRSVKDLQGRVGPGVIAAGADGRLVWAGRQDGEWVLARRTIDGKYDVVRLRRSGVVIPEEGGIDDLQAGSDGAMWFAASNLIGRVTSSGGVRAWRIPAGRLGYPSKSPRPRLAVDSSGTMRFSSGRGIGAITPAGRFLRWEPMLPAGEQITRLVRGGDEHLWAVADSDPYLYERHGPRQVRKQLTSGSAETTYWASLAPDPFGVAVVQGFIEESVGPFGDDLYRNGPPHADGTSNGVVLYTPPYNGSAVSPGRTALLGLPDGRIWVGVTNFHGYESYERTFIDPAEGTPRLLRATRIGATVQAQLQCTGQTSGWCNGTITAHIPGRGSRTAKYTIPAGPNAVRSMSTIRIRLTQAQVKATRTHPITITTSTGIKRSIAPHFRQAARRTGR